jgi:argininosuccinate lyase
MSILTILKGLPSSYNRDLQEDKGALFDSDNTVLDALETFSVMLAGVKIDRKRMNSAAKDPDLLATDLAEHLVKQGMPFRHAHEIVGKLVAFAKKEGIPLDQVSRANLRKISARLDLDLAKILNVKRSLAARTAIGAPAAKNVRAQIERWRKELQ